MRVIFYAEPSTPEQATLLKRVPDGESLEARWVNIQEAHALDNDGNGLRGSELLEWGQYLEDGGHIYPIGMFGLEGHVQGQQHSQSMTIEMMDKARQAQAQ